MSVKKLAVCPPSIVGNPMLLERVLAKYPNATLWKGGRITDEDMLIGFLEGHDAAIVGVNEPITDRVLAALPELEIVGKMAAGCEAIDFDAMKKHGVRFGYTFGVNKLAVAELTLSFMIAGLRMIGQQNLAMRQGDRPEMRPGGLLTKRIVGLHGCGNIGKEMVRLLKPFDCTILACDVKDYIEFYKAVHWVSHRTGSCLPGSKRWNLPRAAIASQRAFPSLKPMASRRRFVGPPPRFQPTSPKVTAERRQGFTFSSFAYRKGH